MPNLFTTLSVEPGTKVKIGEIDPGSSRTHLREAALPYVMPRAQRETPPPEAAPHQFLVTPGCRVRLEDIDPGSHGEFQSSEEVKPQIQSLVRRLDHLQYVLHAEKKHSLLIVLQGMDACGKDGAIRHIFSGMNPAGCRVVGFKKPRPEELDHDFLWRVHPHLPAKGEVTIFNRSHYEDVLVVRVHQPDQVSRWSKRYDLINDFERMLALENGTTVLKFFLYISKAEQLARFKQRLDDPARRWKISEADYEERNYWERYMHAFEDALSKTSTHHAPWFVIPSNLKWFRDLAISQIVTRTMENLDMKVPETVVDLNAIRRRFHAAQEEARA